MSLSEQNRALIERVRRISVTPCTTVAEIAVTTREVSRLLDAARAEGVAALQQAGEPVAQWVMVPREPTSDMLAAADSAIPRFEEESDGSRLMGVDGALDAWKAMIAVSPLPQQTALVEEG